MIIQQWPTAINMSSLDTIENHKQVVKGLQVLCNLSIMLPRIDTETAPDPPTVSLHTNLPTSVPMQSASIQETTIDSKETLDNAGLKATCPGNSDISNCPETCTVPCKKCGQYSECRGVDNGRKCTAGVADSSSTGV